jgi:hypothetical protein
MEINKDLNNRLICNDCNKIFTRTDSLKKHINGRCKGFKLIENMYINEENITVSNEMFKTLKEEIAELKNTILELKEQKQVIPNTTNINSNNTTNNITNNTTNNTINNTIVIKIGNECPERRLTKKDIQYIVTAHKEMLFQRSIEMTHCNKKYPKMNNIYIPDKKMNNACVFTGEQFELKKIKPILYELITTHQDNLDNYRNMDDIIISASKREEMDEFVDNFHTFEDSDSAYKRELYKRVMDDIKLSLYNNKERAREVEKKLKKTKPLKIQS